MKLLFYILPILFLPACSPDLSGTEGITETKSAGKDKGVVIRIDTTVTEYEFDIIL